MTFILETINIQRQKLAKLVSEASPDRLHTIPAGFNNNIIWNFGHLVVSGYSLVFWATKADTGFQIPFYDKYKKGSKPEGITVSKEELDTLLELSGSFTGVVEAALQQNKFQNIEVYATQTFGTANTTIEEMLVTVAMHDTIHGQSMKDYFRILQSHN